MSAPPRRRGALSFALRALLAVAPLALPVTGCDEGVVEPPTAEPAANVAALIAEDADLSTLEDALERSGLDALLTGGGPYTVFAPTDEAFYLLGSQAGGVLLDGANGPLLTEVLRAHVVPGRHSAADLRALAADGGALTSLDGVTLDVTLAADGTLRVAGAPVAETDLEAINGVVHALTGIVHHHLDAAERLALLPYTGTFQQALEQADLLGLLTGEPVTVLVPIDDGFARQPGGGAPLLGAEAGLRSRVLRYHLIPGLHALDELMALDDVSSLEGAALDFHRDARGLPYVNGARVLASNIATANGLLHVVEGPLYEFLTIVERLQLIPQASRVRSALDKVGVTADLNGPGPYTFFVPTDGAFTALGTNVYTTLLANQQGDLLPRLLRHHIAAEAVTSDQLQQGASFPSLDDGHTIDVRRDSTGLLVDEAPLGTHLDLRAANGILHLMDGVLIPDVDVVDRMFLAGYTRFLDLIDIAGLEEELRAGGPYTVVPPLTLFGFYFDPRNYCWAEAAVLSHVGEGIVPYNPLGTGIADLAGGFISLQGTGQEATATRMFGDFIKSTSIRDIQLQATNGVLYGVQDYLSYLPDVRPPCE